MSAGQKLVNLGCGRHFHSDWVNLDLVPFSDEVKAADLINGVPLENNSADAVYHSHVLEHLSPQCGRKMLGECFRVLKPAGYLRIAVPDLEQIAKLYLGKLQAAWETPEPINMADYSWMKLELIDQMVRTSSGGAMGRAISVPDAINKEFLRSRLGSEIENAQSAQASEGRRAPVFSKILGKIKKKLAGWLWGHHSETLDEAEFRRSGEIHRWMYDRVSLRELVFSLGFSDFRICDADESRIPGFSGYQLDALEGVPRKPDSLFIECQKPAETFAKTEATARARLPGEFQEKVA